MSLHETLLKYALVERVLDFVKNHKSEASVAFGLGVLVGWMLL